MSASRLVPGRVILLILLVSSFPIMISLVSSLVNPITKVTSVLPMNETVGGEWLPRIIAVWSIVARIITDPYMAAILIALGMILAAVVRR